VSFLNPVRKIRDPAITGDENPSGRSTFQITF